MFSPGYNTPGTATKATVKTKTKYCKHFQNPFRINFKHLAMVEDWKDVNSLEFPSRKLGVKTKVRSQNRQRPFAFDTTSKSGMSSVWKLSWDVSRYKKLCVASVQCSHTLLWLAILQANAMVTTARLAEEHAQGEIQGPVAF